MCLEERKTESRGRSPAERLIPGRTLAVRRMVQSTTVAITRLPSLLLAFLAEDELARIFHALALIGLGLAERSDLGRDLPDLLVVDAADDDLGRLRDRDRNALRDRIGNVVGVAELQLQIATLHRSTVPDAGDFELALEALGHAEDELGDQCAVGAPHRPRLLGV